MTKWSAAGGFLAATLLFAVTAWGQVAAPSLTPFDFVPENPAVMQWGSPSRIGAAAGQAQAVTTPSSTNPNPAKVNDDYSLTGGGIRLVGRYVSAAAQYSELDSTTRPNNLAEYYQNAGAALAFRLSRSLAVGAGQINQTSRWSQPGGSLRQDDQIPQLGLGLRLGEWFYLGGAAGEDYATYKDSLTPANNFRTWHDVFKYGVGIRTSGTLVAHLEYYVVDYERYAKRNLVYAGKLTANTGVAEFNLGGFLLGYTMTHTDRYSDAPATDTQRLDIGYAPFNGLSVVARGQMDTQKYSASSGINNITTNTYAVLITYLFST